MLTKEVCRSIEQACQVAGALELNGVKLEEPTPAILDIREFDFDVHVAMQPAGTAYYNSLRREAARRLDALKKEFDIWRKKKMLAAKRALTAKRTASKPTKDDIEIRYTVDNEADIIKWNGRLQQRQKTLDDIESWCEAWKQKSFGMRDFSESHADEYYSTDTITEDKVSAGQRRRQRMREVKEQIRNGKKD